MDAIAFNVQQVSEHIPESSLEICGRQGQRLWSWGCCGDQKIGTSGGWFCVSNMDEALEIREEGLQHPLLIFGSCAK